MERRDDDVTTADLAEATRTQDVEDEHHQAPDDSNERTAEADRDEPEADAAGERTDAADQERSPLLPQEEAVEFQSRWSDLQTNFVDEPRRSVQEGDSLVAELMQRLANSFAEERQALEAQWDRGDDVSTEDLRVALQRYRSFFDRLLSA
jgi:hypothetical protein